MIYEKPTIQVVQFEMETAHNIICTSVTDSLIDGGTGVGGNTWTEE